MHDTVAPTIACPSNLVLEATGPSGAVATFGFSATDNCDASPVVFATPASGSAFAVGTNIVVVTAHDACGNTNTCSFTVIVRDTTAPVIECATNRVVVCTATNGAQVSFSVTATDLVDGAVAVSTTPASGSWFAAGTNVVTCATTDTHGNTNTCTFEIVVQDQVTPLLEISMNGGDMILAWPASCTSYALKHTDDLSAPTVWQSVNAPVSWVDGKFQVTLTLGAAQGFYRLEAGQP